MALARQAVALGALTAIVAVCVLATMEFAHNCTWVERHIYRKCTTPDVVAQTYGPVTAWCTDHALSTRRHEHMHAWVQPRRLGWGIIGHIRFALAYNVENARVGYWDNRYEVEARDAESSAARDAELPAP